MKHSPIIYSLLLLFVLASCDKTWTEHYSDTPETVDRNIWDVLQEKEQYSDFVSLIKQYEYDTLFESRNSYTLFIPNNQAMGDFRATNTVDERMLDYHLSLHFIQSRNIQGKERIQTRSEKFALFENTGSALYLDGIEVTEESPLYLNGKYFELAEAAVPLPNIFEFFEEVNPIFTDFIESLDSVVLDRELSRPLGYDEDGNTIYDTVSEIYNIFEDYFFPIREEFRNKAATMVFPDLEDYNLALDEMAGFLGGDYTDHKDIPQEWQYEILMPYLLEHGVFENRVEPDEFIHPPFPDTLKLKNILGDSVYIEYDVTEVNYCSNGYTYDYLYFDIPDTLYKSPQRLEGETLVESTGPSTYAWREGVNVIQDVPIAPRAQIGDELSNDSMLFVQFVRKYDGAFEIEFNFPNLFPGNYLMVVRTNMHIGGIYDIFINDIYEYTMDYFDFMDWNGVWLGESGTYYRPDGAFNSFDVLVNNTADYGKTRVKFVYTEPGEVLNNGLTIDYIDFIPLEN